MGGAGCGRRTSVSCSAELSGAFFAVSASRVFTAASPLCKIRAWPHCPERSSSSRAPRCQLQLSVPHVPEAACPLRATGRQRAWIPADGLSRDRLPPKPQGPGTQLASARSMQCAQAWPVARWLSDPARLLLLAEQAFAGSAFGTVVSSEDAGEGPQGSILAARVCLACRSSRGCHVTVDWNRS